MVKISEKVVALAWYRNLFKFNQVSYDLNLKTNEHKSHNFLDLLLILVYFIIKVKPDLQFNFCWILCRYKQNDGI